MHNGLVIYKSINQLLCCGWIKCHIICVFNNAIIVQVRGLDTLLLKHKKFPVLDITGIFFRIRTQVTTLVLRTSAFTRVLMRKKKHVISNTGRFFCVKWYCILYIMLYRLGEIRTHNVSGDRY
jgi:hypothetical protein